MADLLPSSEPGLSSLAPLHGRLPWTVLTTSSDWAGPLQAQPTSAAASGGSVLAWQPGANRSASQARWPSRLPNRDTEPAEPAQTAQRWPIARSSGTAAPDRAADTDTTAQFPGSTPGEQQDDSPALIDLISDTDPDPVPTGSDPITGLQDGVIRQAVDQALQDKLFSHRELADLLRLAGSGGISAMERNDLQLIGDQMVPYLPAASQSYSAYIYAAVVDGNPANRSWTAGGETAVPLGDLTVGSTERQLRRLVAKWFGGRDLPANSVTGDQARGGTALRFDYGRMRGDLFVDDVSFEDVNQGAAGSCFLLAALASLAQRQPETIKEMFVDNGDGSYGVRFYSSTGAELWVTVNRSVPMRRGELLLARNPSRSATGEMWVALVEKAYAQANEIGRFRRETAVNAYSAIEGGLAEAFQHLQGSVGPVYSAYFFGRHWNRANDSLSRWNNYRDAAFSAIEAGRAALVIAYHDSRDINGRLMFVTGHTYAVIGYDPTQESLLLANPWGPAATATVTVFQSDWRSLFRTRAVLAVA